MSPIAYSVPITAVAAAKLTATQWNASVRDNILFLANPPACRVYRTTAQTIANSSNTALAFNSERYDTAAMHDNVTNNSRITIPTTGIYHVGGGIEWSATGAYTQAVFIIKNAATFLAQITAESGAPLSRVNLSTTDKFNAGEFVELWVVQFSGGNLNINATGNVSPEFWATWVGLG